jgi:hypothetical protein
VLITRAYLKVGDEGRAAHYPIPEAETWPDLQRYLDGGSIERCQFVDANGKELPEPGDWRAAIDELNNGRAFLKRPPPPEPPAPPAPVPSPVLVPIVEAFEIVPVDLAVSEEAPAVVAPPPEPPIPQAQPKDVKRKNRGR